MIRLFLFVYLLVVHESAYSTLVGGRPNSISGGQNAFAGVVNPASAVWIKDRVDIGAFWQNQKSSLNNRDNNPLFPQGKTDLTYKARNLLNFDLAVHKRFQFNTYEGSCGLATYTTPAELKVRSKNPIRISGSTPIRVGHKVQAISLIFSLKLNSKHSIGISADYFYLAHLRNGFQNSDNALRSVSPGHVTNKGTDHSAGMGCSLGWHWNITEALEFGAAFTKKSFVGQFRKYRGFEPHHANNYIPATIGAGFSYKFSQKIAGRLEWIFSNFGDLPGANNNVLANNRLNVNKRGSKKSPGPGLQNANFLNVGLGYNFNPMISIGMGFSHRFKCAKSSNFLSHSYTRQVVYDLLSFGANIRHQKHDLFLSTTIGFKNKVSGDMPKEIGGGRFIAEKQNASVSFSWGYLY